MRTSGSTQYEPWATDAPYDNADLAAVPTPTKKSAPAAPASPPTRSAADGAQGQLVRETWSGNLVSTPEALVEPVSVAELQAAVLKAVSEGRTPLVVRGRMHSWSAVAVQDEGTAIDLTRLIRPPQVDREKKTVTVSGATPLKDIYSVLAENGLAFAHVPTIETVTAAGAAATGSHGADRESGIFSEQILSLRLIDGQGRDILIDRDGVWQVYGGRNVPLKSGPHYLEHARHHLGVLGAIYELTFSCVPAYDLELVQKPMPEAKAFGENYADLRRYFETHEQAGMGWFMPEKRVLLRYSNRTDKKRTPYGWFKKTVVEDWIQTRAASALMKHATAYPNFGKKVHTLSAYAFLAPTVRRDRSDRIQSALPGHATPDVGLRAMEYAVPFARFEEAMDIARDALRDYDPLLPLYLRRSGTWMYFEILWPEGYFGGEAAARRFEAALIARFGSEAFPHDGKIYFTNPWPRVPEERKRVFMELKEELDPDGAFTNDHMRRYLAGEEL